MPEVIERPYPPSYPIGGGAAPPPLPTQLAAPPPDPSGTPAYGTMIQVLTSAAGVTPETYATIQGVGDITGPNPQVAETDTTSHSTGSAHRTFVPALIDSGQLSFKMFWMPNDPTQSPTSSYGLQFLFENRTVTKFRIINTDPNHRTRTVSGFVKQLNETYPVAGMCEMQTIIRLSGAATIVASALSMTPASATPTAAGGPGTVAIATGNSSTYYTGTADVPWITVTAPVGGWPTQGDQTVSYTVAVNAVGQPLRVGHILFPALGLTFTVTQAAG